MRSMQVSSWGFGTNFTDRKRQIGAGPSSSLRSGSKRVPNLNGCYYLVFSLCTCFSWNKSYSSNLKIRKILSYREFLHADVCTCFLNSYDISFATTMCPLHHQATSNSSGHLLQDKKSLPCIFTQLQTLGKTWSGAMDINICPN